MNKIIVLLVMLLVMALPVRAAMEVNSFELFWPLVAGKTVVDPLYKLKLFKENIRGALIFGNLQKADYLVFLAVKRGLEVEKLLLENNLSAAQKTSDLVQQTLTKASTNIDQYKSTGGTDTAGLGPQIVTRLDNLTKLFVWLSGQNDQNTGLLQPLLDQISTLKARL